MGLDSFWQLPEDDKDVKFDPPLRLCGGMLSGNGEGSFRGKVYDYLVEAVTGESLYQEKIEPEVIQKMAEALNRTDYDSLPEDLRTEREDISDRGAVTQREYEDLRRMFSTYARVGACLKGWW